MANTPKRHGQRLNRRIQKIALPHHTTLNVVARILPNLELRNKDLRPGEGVERVGGRRGQSSESHL